MLCPYKTSGAWFYEPTVGRFVQVGKKKEGRSIAVKNQTGQAAAPLQKKPGGNCWKRLGGSGES
jgi:hypothetical protein